MPATRPTTSLAKRLKRRLGLSTALLLVLAVLAACGVQPAPALPGNGDRAGLQDDAQVRVLAPRGPVLPGVPMVVTRDDSHPAQRWIATLRVEKRLGDDPSAPVIEVVEAQQNLLTTAGAGQLWSGLTSAGLATPFNATNTQLAVGDGTAAAAAGQTDLQAAAGAATGGDITGATNATPIVLTMTSAPTVSVGQVVVVAGVNGNTAANGTFAVSAVSGSSVTLLDSAGNGAFTTSTGSTLKVINKYRQLVSAAPTLSTNQVQWSATFATTSANFAWAEWSVTTGGAAANKQASPPPTLLNRAVPAGTLGTKTSAASWTLQLTLSLT